MAVSPLFLRGLPLPCLRLHQHRLLSGVLSGPHRAWCTATEPAPPDGDASSSSSDKPPAILAAVAPPPPPPVESSHRLEDPDYRRWKDKEHEIFRDIEPTVSTAKLILHSERYMDGERLTTEDEKLVVHKLLHHHPHAHDKIGCGLDYIMVDRHPRFRQSRCLFVVRTDGVWIDFSYQKCLRAYIRDKYPSHAERFIREHFKRGSDSTKGS